MTDQSEIDRLRAVNRELVEACEPMLDQLTFGRCMGEVAYADMLRKARAAIARAEGGEG